MALPAHLFHAEGSTFAHTNAVERQSFWDPQRQGRILTLPRWRIAAEHLRAVPRAPLTASQRRSCYAAVVRHYATVDRAALANDLKSLAYRVGTTARRRGSVA